jgi:protoporphyrinogen oxidase
MAGMHPAAGAAPMTHPDVLVLGAGPAGLGAALHAARSGARVLVVDHGRQVGGLCVTRTHGGLRYDLGGHIPFVHDARRRAWLAGLLGKDLVWVPRPVSSWREGVVRPGRYLDQRPGGAPLGAPIAAAPSPGPRDSARTVLDAIFGPTFTDSELRPYLEKIDGVALDRIPGVRPLRLMHEQAAPEGFWFPAGGIGQLMDAMTRAIRSAGGQVLTETEVTAIVVPDGRVGAVRLAIDGRPVTIGTSQLVVSAPPGIVARVLNPGPAPAQLPPVRMRAVCLVYLEVARPHLTDEAWVQIDDPRVPAARIFEMSNWSAAMCPGNRTVLGMECYCAPTSDDPLWISSDRDLAARCAASLVDPLGWLDTSDQARLIEVIRLASAYPSPDLRQLDATNAAARVLESIDGLHLARGSAVIDAIRAGELCAAAALPR